MTTTTSPFWAGYRAAVYGGLLAGGLDLAAAIISGFVRGTAAQTIMQSIASGALGRAAFSGGMATAALGVALHFAIMLIIAAVFVTASHRLRWPARQPWFSGPAYGIAVYCVMSLIVVPLSAAPFTISHEPMQVVQGVLIHILCVGLPIAWLAGRANTQRE